jgi:TetR/AcrR family transcriptional regulator, lmrAB and yxaGH operons repressor
MTKAPAPKADIVRKLADVFRRHGYEGASLKLLSQATGLGRSSLYHYFPNGKEDMASAVLSSADTWSLEHLRPILESTAPPSEKARRLADALDAFYDGGRKSCLLELFAIGDARDLFGERVAQRLSGLERLFARVAKEAGASPSDAARRGEDALIDLHGALVVSRGRGDPAPFQRFLKQLPIALTE